MTTSTTADRPSTDEIPSGIVQLLNNKDESPVAKASAIENVVTGLPHDSVDVLYAWADSRRPAGSLHIDDYGESLLYEFESDVPEVNIDAESVIEGVNITTEVELYDAALEIPAKFDDYDEALSSLNTLISDAENNGISVEEVGLHKAVDSVNGEGSISELRSVLVNTPDRESSTTEQSSQGENKQVAFNDLSSVKDEQESTSPERDIDYGLDIETGEDDEADAKSSESQDGDGSHTVEQLDLDDLVSADSSDDGEPAPDSTQESEDRPSETVFDAFESVGPFSLSWQECKKYQYDALIGEQSSESNEQVSEHHTKSRSENVSTASERVSAGGSELTSEEGTAAEPQSNDGTQNAREPSVVQHPRHRIDGVQPMDAEGGILPSNYVQDLTNFEYVLDSGDGLPDDVDPTGMVKVDDDTYLAIAKVEPNEWQFKPHSQKQDKATVLVRQVLSSLDFPTQIYLLPTQVKAKDHVNEMKASVESDPNNDKEENPLLFAARKAYADWFTSFIETNEMQQIEPYIIITVSEEQIHQQRNQNSFRQNLAKRIGDMPILGALSSSLEDSPDEDLSRLQLVRELSARLEKTKRNLQSMDIGLEPVESKQDALSVLFQHHNHHEPNYQFQPNKPGRAVDASNEQPNGAFAAVGGVGNE